MSNAYQAPQADLSAKKTSRKANPVTQDMVDNLARGRIWAMFVAVLFYIFFGGVMFFAVISLFGGLKGIIIGAILAVLGFLLFKLARFLHKYSRAINELQDSINIDDLIESQEQFSRYIKVMGIFNIIWVLLAVLGVVLAFVAPQLLMRGML